MYRCSILCSQYWLRQRHAIVRDLAVFDRLLNFLRITKFVKVNESE